MFVDWMVNRDVGELLRLVEAAEYFTPQDYNAVFNGELEKLLTRIHDPDLRQNVEASRGFDWGGYISRSLLRAGFRGDDQQEVFHQIVVKLLVEPGKLFGGWEPKRHGPLEWRFRASVWNAIRNAQEKNRNRQRWMHTADPSVMAGQFAGRQPPNNIIGEFQQLIFRRLGKLALAVLDQRLAGRDTKDLLGAPGFTTHILKREIRAIKELAQQFARQTGDPAFANMVAKAMDAESATVAKRKAAVAAR